MIERFNPYDLNQVGQLNNQLKLRKETQRAIKNERARRMIEDLRARNELNPYDLGQLADIFGLPDPEDFW